MGRFDESGFIAILANLRLTTSNEEPTFSGFKVGSPHPTPMGFSATSLELNQDNPTRHPLPPPSRHQTQCLWSLLASDRGFIRSDRSRGQVHVGRLLTKFLEEKGITQETAAPGTPQQSGVAERMNQRLSAALTLSTTPDGERLTNPGSGELRMCRTRSSCLGFLRQGEWVPKVGAKALQLEPRDSVHRDQR